MEKKIKKRKIRKIVKIFIYLLFLFIYFLASFINIKFGDISFEQILFNVIYSEGANLDVVYEGIFFVFLRLGIIISIIYIFDLILKKLELKAWIKFYFNNKLFKIELFKSTIISSIIGLSIVGYCSLSNAFSLLNLDDYIKSQRTASNLFEEYYVDGKEVKLSFPKEKRNLIYIFVESMESTNVSIKNGGAWKKTNIPNLESLALDNINFSNTNKIGGALQVNNTEWTIAGIIAQTAGVPLKIPINGNEYSGFAKSLPGVYNLGDILYDNGYNNYFMIGSDANYGGRKDYFEDHGNYEIYDLLYAKEKGLIEKDYFVWWGYEDKKLFSFAKKEILKAVKEDKPFNFTILTVDTHFTDGYMDDSCKDIFDSKYANSIYCSDQKINKFINWIKNQDFYEKTTIIISGDHLTMQNNFYNDLKNKRTIYNTIINSPIKPIQEKNRLFSSFDMFPTTLASLGVKIDGNRLGLGVNLFSKEETLIEELGIDYVNSEISKKSFYYDNVILKDSYYEMQEMINTN